MTITDTTTEIQDLVRLAKIIASPWHDFDVHGGQAEGTWKLQNGDAEPVAELSITDVPNAYRLRARTLNQGFNDVVLTGPFDQVVDQAKAYLNGYVAAVKDAALAEIGAA